MDDGSGRWGGSTGWVWLCLLWLPVTAGAVDVVAVDRPPRIDGVLVEWGAPEWIPIVPSGKKVGVRGVFTGEDDHEVDAYLMWDADFIYAAVVVVDDSTDVSRVEPGDHVWNGPSGERKDKMFYFDHLKVFLRGPEAPLGFNVWFAPTDGVQGPFWWGGRQRHPGREDIPVRVGSTWREGIYTYELAFPWKWLGIHPQPGMELDAMFLLPDSDLPGVALRKKIRKSNKWIWWKGTVRLVGKPPGLKPLPKSVVVEEIRRQTQAIVLPTPKPREEPAVEEESSREESAGRSEERAVTAEESREGETAETASEIDTAQEAASTLALSSLRSRLSRQLLLKMRIAPAPAWVRELGREVDLSEVQVDSLYYRLTTNLHRLTDSGINSRTDGLVMDMAEYAGIWRAPARDLLSLLLERVVDELGREGGEIRAKIAAAATETGIEEKRVVGLVESICKQALKGYREGRVSTTNDLMQKARRKAGLSPEETRNFTRALVRDWAE